MRKKSGLRKDVSSILREAPEKNLRKAGLGKKVSSVFGEKEAEKISSLLKKTSPKTALHETGSINRTPTIRTASIETSVGTKYKKSRQVFGIDISEKSIKVVWFSKDGVLSTAMSELPASLSGNKWFRAVASAIRKILKEHRVKARKANCTISGSSVFFRQIKLPRMEGEELKQTIRWEIKKILPPEITDVVVDFAMLREVTERGVNKEELLIAGIERNRFSKLLFSLRYNGIKVLKVDVVPFSLLNAFLETEHSNATIALVDIGANETNIAVVRENSLLFTRKVEIGEDNFTKALSDNFSLSTQEAESLKKEKDLFSPESAEFPIIRPVFERLQRELERSLNYFTTAGGEYVSRILMSGGGGKLKGLDAYLGEKMGLPVKIPEQPDPQFVIAAGAAFSSAGGINLLSPRIEARKKLKPRLKTALVMGALGLVFIYGVLLGTEIYLRKELQEKKSQLSASEPLVRKVMRTIAIRELVNRHSPCLEVLQELRSLIPGNVWITELGFDKESNLKIEGRALSNVGVTQFLGKLESSKFIKKAQLGSIRQMGISKKKIVVFEIDCYSISED